eukprot:comp22434_c1_seq1/m.33679 comp22434_c1_seq1/g.33679  ORF comp22434_c1_seq1/g.33679 comp22434_c1_seq1/m.33679 type:complete len:715 (-) comp22434_c1_seq1:531-2675(-)
MAAMEAARAVDVLQDRQNHTDTPAATGCAKRTSDDNSEDGDSDDTPTKRLRLGSEDENNPLTGTSAAKVAMHIDEITPVKQGPDIIVVPDKPQKKPSVKLTPAEKEQRKKEAEERKRQKEEEKKKKDEEKKKREEEKEAKRLEKQQKEEERLKEKQKKEEEKRLKEEERIKKEEEKRQKEEERLREKQKKDEEKKAKDEERERKRLEKEREEKKREQIQQKQQGILLKLFKKPQATTSESETTQQTQENTSVNQTPTTENTSLTNTATQEQTAISDFERWIFPFEVKAHMTLAPEIPGVSQDSFKESIEKGAGCDYLSELKQRGARGCKRVPWCPRRVSEKREPENEDGNSANGVTCIVVDDLEKEQGVSKVQDLIRERGGFKLLQFHDNYRPPFYGTHPRHNCLAGRRNPFANLEGFNYEEDSDEEWEEEPAEGESLTGDEEEEEDKEEKEEGEEEEEDGFVVPHGYLSDDEGLDAEEGKEGGGDKDARKTEAKAAENQAKKVQPLRLVKIGCVWAGDTNVPADVSALLNTFRITPLMQVPVDVGQNENTGAEEEEKGEGEEAGPKQRGVKRKEFPEDLVAEFLHMVHGSLKSKEELVEEFRRNHSDLELSKVVVREKLTALADKKGRGPWQGKDTYVQQYGLPELPAQVPTKPSKATPKAKAPAITSFFSSLAARKEAQAATQQQLPRSVTPTHADDTATNGGSSFEPMVID